ncbi:CotH kinase family protein [Carboxylicivirga marina]|uniref:CotH kinase family protein n=1 Tax=Carboxylicivirga marina TaxID=2800988 RepID=UPI00259998D6|nr:CotH kinase family protein [uncultured Carboxylicivirga sp.]
MISSKKKATLFILIAFLFALNTSSQIQFPAGSAFRFLKGVDANQLDSSWINASYDDSEWSLGNAPFRYGDGADGTKLIDMRYSYSTLYLRSDVIANNIESIEKLSFRVNFDDGFVIWVNGVEAFRRNAPEVLSSTSFAPQNHESGFFEEVILSKDDMALIEGNNTIAIQCFNISLASTDFYFDVDITAERKLPKLNLTLNEGFSHRSGFYNEPFILNITSPDESAMIYYTLDGSHPAYTDSLLIGNSRTEVYIDPRSIQNRAQTPAFIIRACLFKEGYELTQPISRTFIFPNSVRSQSHPGGAWPATSVNNQLIDLDISQEVVNDSRYASVFDKALKDIPSISVMTSPDNLFNSLSGIYVNAYQHGIAWERECSFELINSQGDSSVFSNAGIRIRGGFSRSPDNPKHAFRLFFRDEYGNKELEHSMFGKYGVDSYRKIDLRTAQNYSWSFENSHKNTFVREVFSRDTQRDMGRPYTRSNYYHLYLNGMYWGLYQTQERSEANYAEDYLGGEKEEYDVIKVDAAGGYVIEASDGNLDAWQKVYNLCLQGFLSNENYFKLEGKTFDGQSSEDIEALVDIDNLIDYMLIIFYTGNFDAPISKNFGNDSPNNYYAIKNRADSTKGFVFFVHDAEHSMLDIAEDRVNLGSDVSVSHFAKFNPHWLHEKLKGNKEYRLRFADRALLHLEGTGVLTTAMVQKRFLERVDQIKDAIIVESARWGDSKRTNSYTKDDDWVPEINNVIYNYVSKRTEVVIEQLKIADLYSSLMAPNIKRNGSILTKSNYALTDRLQVELSNPNPSGHIYYTIDNHDPREIGGSVSPAAERIITSETLQINQSTIIKSRVYDKGKWSAMKRIAFNNYGEIKVTELNYHPQDEVQMSDTISGKAYEFIELKNTDAGRMDLSGVSLDSAIYYRFPINSILEPDSFYVIATKPKYFEKRYGMEASGNCQGFFNNGGEFVLVNDPDGQELLSFTYRDRLPWPVKADGMGYTLTSKENYPRHHPNQAEYWMNSSMIGGTPFRDDVNISFDSPDSTHVDNSDWNVYPNPTNGEIIISIDSENSSHQYVLIHNISGQVVYQSNMNHRLTVDFTKIGVARGIYIVRVVSGHNIFQKKIVFQ